MFSTWTITTKSLEGCYESIFNDFSYPSAFLKECRTFMWVNQHWPCFTSVSLPDVPQFWAMICQLASSLRSSANDGTRRKYNPKQRGFIAKNAHCFRSTDLDCVLLTKLCDPISNKMSGYRTLKNIPVEEDDINMLNL